MTKRFVLFVAAVLTIVPAICRAAEPQIVRKVLDNGLTVIVKPEKGTGLVAIVAMVKAGAARESLSNAGIGNFVANLVLASTRQRSAEDIAMVADEVGGNVEALWDPDLTQIRAITTSARFNEAMSLIGECLTEANFEPQWVEQVRSDLGKRAVSETDSLFTKSYDTLRELLYEDNGYRRPSLGFERTIKVASAQDLHKFYSTYYVPNNTVITIVGDVTVERAIDRADKAFAGVSAAKLPLDRGVPDEKLDRSKLKASEQDMSTAYLMVGWLAPGIGSPDYPAMAVASSALGGGKGSIMFRELRQNRGMGYEVGTLYPRHKYQSHVLAYIVTDPFKSGLSVRQPQIWLEEIKTALVDEASKLKDAPLSAQDLERAKGYTIGSYALEHQHMHERAYLLGWMEAVGVGYEFDHKFADEIAKVTADDVARVARKYFTNYAAVLLLPRTISPATHQSP